MRLEHDLNAKSAQTQFGMSESQWGERRPPTDSFNDLVIACWNFAGGWDADKLYTAAIFYNVDDIDALLTLGLVIKKRIDSQPASDEHQPAG